MIPYEKPKTKLLITNIKATQEAINTTKLTKKKQIIRNQNLGKRYQFPVVGAHLLFR